MFLTRIFCIFFVKFNSLKILNFSVLGFLTDGWISQIISKILLLLCFFFAFVEACASKFYESVISITNFRSTLISVLGNFMKEKSLLDNSN